jgi:hypothetical protein
MPKGVYDHKRGLGESESLRMLDLFAGRLGWTKAFLARGWECVAVDLVEPPEIPQG